MALSSRGKDIPDPDDVNNEVFFGGLRPIRLFGDSQLGEHKRRPHYGMASIGHGDRFAL